MQLTLLTKYKLERPVSKNDKYFIVDITINIGNKIVQGRTGWISPTFDIKEFETKGPKNCKVISVKQCRSKKEYNELKSAPF